MKNAILLAVFVSVAAHAEGDDAALAEKMKGGKVSARRSSSTSRPSPRSRC